MPAPAIPSPGTVLEDLVTMQGELASIDDRRTLVLVEIKRLKGLLLPCIADGAELTIAFGYSPIRKYVQVSRTGEELDAQPLKIVHHFDLEWPDAANDDDAADPIGPGPGAPSYTVPTNDDDPADCEVVPGAGQTSDGHAYTVEDLLEAGFAPSVGLDLIVLDDEGGV